MRWGTGARVAVELCGWGLVFGVVAAVLVLGFPLTLEAEFATSFGGIVLGAVVGAVLGGVLGLPVGVLVALTTRPEPRTMAWLAVAVYLATAGAALLYGFVAEVPDSFGLLRLAVFPILVTLPFAAMRVHRTVHRAVAREGSSA